MECALARKLLTALVDGERYLLGSDATQVEDHVRNCGSCSMVYRNQKHLKSRVQSIRLPDPPPHLSDRVRDILKSSPRRTPVILRFSTSIAAACLVLVLMFAMQKSASAEPPQAVRSSALFFDRIVEKREGRIISAHSMDSVCGCLKQKLPCCTGLKVEGFKCSCTKLESGESACIVYSKDGELIGLFPCDDLRLMNIEFKSYVIGRMNVLIRTTAKGAVLCVSRLPADKLRDLLGSQ
jgi:hypothetical protein